MDALGPNTEALFAQAFAKRCLLNCKEAATLLGLDHVTLATLTEIGVIRAVRAGGSAKTRRYAEHDLRAYLLKGPTARPSMAARRAATVKLSCRSRAGGFTERMRRKAEANP